MSTLLLLDFDGTITESDTLAHLASYGYSLQAQDPKIENQENLSREISSREIPSWSEITRSYMTDLSTHTPAFSHSFTLNEQISNSSSLLPLERASIHRVENAGIFRGATVAGLHAAGRRAVLEDRTVIIRPGVRECMQRVLASGGAVGVLSVNWSRAWIEGCLSAALWREGVGEILVVSNELVFNQADRKSLGKFTRRWGDTDEGLWTGSHKARALREIWGSWLFEPERRVIYVGDSTTDLEALLAVDVGIGIGPKEVKGGLRDVFTRLLKGSRDVGDWKGDDDRGTFWAKGFEEILGSGVLERVHMPH